MYSEPAGIISTNPMLRVLDELLRHSISQPAILQIIRASQTEEGCLFKDLTKHTVVGEVWRLVCNSS